MLKNSILQKLEQRSLTKKKPLNLGVYYKNTLVALCHALEDFILESDSEPLMITAFQRGKWYLQEATRYQDLAEKSCFVAILAAPETGFEEHPTSKLANVALVSLEPTDPVAQEWHLIILSSTYTAMVLCQELSEEDYGQSGIPTEDKERKFYGFWTFEPELVKETVELTINHIEGYQPELAAKLTAEVEGITANLRNSQQDDLDKVVSKVVNYLEKTHTSNEFGSEELDNNLSSNKMQAFLRMAQLIDQADVTNPQAATEVSALAEAMGQLLDLPAWQVKRLRLAALLHRLAPIKSAKQINQLKTEVQEKVLKQEKSVAKASVLRIMPQLQAVSNIITHQTEWWDGSSGPDGLAYDNIPLESRILALLAEFQAKVNKYQNVQTGENPLTQALTECQQQAGVMFDPKLVEALTLLVMGMQQGMNIQASQPKIASGMWLLESEPVQLIIKN